MPRTKKKSTKKPAKTEAKVQSEPETTLQATASDALLPSAMSGDADKPDAPEQGKQDTPKDTGNDKKKSTKRRGNSRERVADNDVKLQIRVSPRVAAILSEAAAARRCPLSNYCAILLSDIAFKEADAAPVLTKEQEAEAAAIAAHMMGEDKGKE